MKLSKQLRSHLIFNRSQRGGIFFLMIVLASLLYGFYFFDFSEKPRFDVSSAKITALQKQIDSLKMVEIENRKPKRYPFNPNFLTDFKAYTFGMSPEEFDRLALFRSKDQWINSATQFQKVTKISDSLQVVISAYFKFPEWVNRSHTKAKRTNTYTLIKKNFSQKKDLNTATSEELKQVYGIGEALSTRIVNYREKLGGFTNDVQLHSVYGLSASVIEKTLNEFTVKNPKELLKMNVNSVSASDIATIPGVSFELAKRIWEFVKLRDGISDISELEKIEGITISKLSLIRLYLSVE